MQQVTVEIAAATVLVDVDPAGAVVDVTVPSPQVTILGTDLVGPQGPPGADGASTISAVAQSAIVVGRLVSLTAAGASHFDPSVVDAANRVAGLSKQSASPGGTVEIQSGGVVTLAGLGLTPGARYFAGPAGTLVTAVPATGYAVAVGHAITADSLLLSIGPYLQRN